MFIPTGVSLGVAQLLNRFFYLMFVFTTRNAYASHWSWFDIEWTLSSLKKKSEENQNGAIYSSKVVLKELSVEADSRAR